MQTDEQKLSGFTDEERFLLKKALSRLSCYDDTPRGLLLRLSEKKYKQMPVSGEAAKKVVRFLVREGLLREREYAENLISALKSRGYGTRRILRELHLRKFSEEVCSAAREALQEASETEETRALEMLKKRAVSRKSDLSDRNEIQKLYAYLARLGFDSSVARTALSKLTKEDFDE